jgi:hypothetical protein
MKVAKWVKADDAGDETEENKDNISAMEDGPRVSMEHWPTMVDNLIDL